MLPQTLHAGASPIYPFAAWLKASIALGFTTMFSCFVFGCSIAQNRKNLIAVTPFSHIRFLLAIFMFLVKLLSVK